MDGGNEPGAAETPLEVAHKDGVVTLTLNRPKALNALSGALMAELQAALDRIAVDRQTRVVVLKGAGRAFCAGHDLSEMEGLRAAPDGGRQAYQALFAQCSRLMTSIPRLPQPVIAEVHGIATAAGCQLVASCDLAVAAEDTRFGVNGVNIGLFCSTPMVALSRNIGRKKAFEMLSMGGFLSAPEAVQAGLINRAVPGDALVDAVAEMAGTLAKKLPVAIRHGKRAFYEQAEMPLDQAYAHTARVIAENMLEPETAEGVQAFLEKRPPSWER
ncbi:MAG: enoyl-CoA hydratase [Pseudomonadota bacterium]